MDTRPRSYFENPTDPRFATAAKMVATLARDIAPALAALIVEANAAEASFRNNPTTREGFAIGYDRNEAQDALASLPYFLTQAIQQLGRIRVDVVRKQTNAQPQPTMTKTRTTKTTAAAAPRAEWVRDESVAAWCLQAPAGYRLGDDLHEFVYDFDTWRGQSREAKREAFERLAAEGGVQPCTAAHCDWCNGANAAHVVAPCSDPHCWCTGEIPGASRGGMTR